MPVNIEIKGNLARLLATENLIVEHKQVETAQFDVDRRVLTLPMWNTVSNFVYDMLVAHEVGHALFTPNTMWKKDEYANVPQSYVNVVEDARIERLMKQKFAGLNRDFYKGYEELNALDFFELQDVDINQLKLIDKINLYFKLGAYLCLDFNDTENQFITEISKAETFEEVLSLSKRIYEYSKQQAEERKQEMQKQEINLSSLEDTSDSNSEEIEMPTNTDDASDQEIDADADIDDPDFEESEDDDYGAGNTAGNWDNIDESDTQESFDRNSDSLKDNEARETNYVEIPEMNLDNVVVDFETIYQALKVHFEAEDTGEQSSRNGYYYCGNSLSQERLEFNKYKRSASKDVNNLVKEFEMQKAADSYARQSIAKTGVLDTSKLHTYMYNDDIFKKITVVPDGKNHGLVFLLDWSGSMAHILKDTVKQLFNLVWFCRKVNIPYEVYSFTNDGWCIGEVNQERSFDADYNLVSPERIVSQIKEGNLHIDGGFRMVNILSSTKKSKKLDEMMLLLWLQVNAFSNTKYNYYRRFSLSGTPLNEAIIAAGQLTKRLIKSAKLQKCHVITLTDGEGYYSQYNTLRDNYTGGKEMTKRGIYPHNTVIRHKGRTFTGAMSEPEFTCKIVEAVKSDIPNCNFVGIRILERNGLSNFYNYYGRQYYDHVDQMRSQMKKKGVVSFKSLAFDMWFALNSKDLSVEDELDVQAGAEKRKITAAFRKMNKGKKSNKFMTKEFISQIA